MYMVTIRHYLLLRQRVPKSISIEYICFISIPTFIIINLKLFITIIYKLVFLIPNFILTTVVPQKTITFYIPIFTLKVKKFLCSFNMYDMYLCACRHVVLSYNVVVVVTEPERPLILVSINLKCTKVKTFSLCKILIKTIKYFQYLLPFKSFPVQTIFLS